MKKDANNNRNINMNEKENRKISKVNINKKKRGNILETAALVA